MAQNALYEIAPVVHLHGATQRPDVSLARLRRREWEVLALMAEGHSNFAIAGKLFVTLAAVERHVT